MTFLHLFVANALSDALSAVVAITFALAVALVQRRRARQRAAEIAAEPLRVMSWKCPGCGCRMDPAGLVEVSEVEAARPSGGTAA